MPCIYNHQQEFDYHLELRPSHPRFQISRGGIWNSVPELDEDAMSGALNEIQYLGDLADASDVVVPLVGCLHGDIEPGYGTEGIPELSHRKPEELQPDASNGILQNFISGIRDEAARFWAKRGVTSIPQSEKQATKLESGNNTAYVPAWMNDIKYLASLEKSIRNTALPHVLDLVDVHRGEAESSAIATRLFLETGWSPSIDSDYPPRSVRESTALSSMLDMYHKQRSKVYGTDLWGLASVGLVSEWTLNNGNETSAAITAPWVSVKGFDGTGDIASEDMDSVHDIIDGRLHGQEVRPYIDYYARPSRHADTLLELANQIWGRMRALDGVTYGCRREAEHPILLLRGSGRGQPERRGVRLPGDPLIAPARHTTGGRVAIRNPTGLSGWV